MVVLLYPVLFILSHSFSVQYSEYAVSPCMHTQKTTPNMACIKRLITDCFCSTCSPPSSQTLLPPLSSPLLATNSSHFLMSLHTIINKLNTYMALRFSRSFYSTKIRIPAKSRLSVIVTCGQLEIADQWTVVSCRICTETEYFLGTLTS